MRRRQFLSHVVLGSVISVRIARGQTHGAVPRIGILFGLSEADTEGQVRLRIFLEGLHRLRGAHGDPPEIITRWSAGDNSRIEANADELVRLAPEVILATNTPSLKALHERTRAIPIVFVNVGDPIGIGVVKQLARPEGNATGFSLFQPEIGAKLVSFVRAIRPDIRAVTALFNPDTGIPRHYVNSIAQATRAMAVPLIEWPVRSRADIERTLEAYRDGPSTAVIVVPDPFAVVHRELIVTLLNKIRAVAIYPFKQFTRAGGLMSYGVDLNDQYRQAASYVDRILKGASAGNLPVQAPTKFELVINKRTADELGVKIPHFLLAGADEVLE